MALNFFFTVFDRNRNDFIFQKLPMEDPVRYFKLEYEDYPQTGYHFLYLPGPNVWGGFKVETPWMKDANGQIPRNSDGDRLFSLDKDKTTIVEQDPGIILDFNKGILYDRNPNIGTYAPLKCEKKHSTEWAVRDMSSFKKTD